jgi:hypothetical protein
MTRTSIALFLGLLIVGDGACQANPSSKEQTRTASGILVHYPADVRTAEAWKGHSFLVNGVPVQPSEKVPESELLKYVGKKVTVTGRWNPGVVWSPAKDEARLQAPLDQGRDGPVIRGDGIVVETVQELKDK